MNIIKPHIRKFGAPGYNLQYCVNYVWFADGKPVTSDKLFSYRSDALQFVRGKVAEYKSLGHKVVS